MAEDIDKDIEQKSHSVFGKLSQPKRKGLSARIPKIRNKQANKIPENQEAVPVDVKEIKEAEDTDVNSVGTESKESDFKTTIDSHIDEENNQGQKSTNPQNRVDIKAEDQTVQNVSSTTTSKVKNKTSDKKKIQADRGESISTNISFEHLLMLLKLKRKIRKAKKVKITHNDVIEEGLEIVSKNLKKLFSKYKKDSHDRSESLKVNVTEFHFDLLEDICFDVRKEYRINLGFNDIVEVALEQLYSKY